MNSIQIYDRKNQTQTTELVFGEKPMRALYGNPIGRFLANTVLSGTGFSRAYGSFQSKPGSVKAIPNFVRQFAIPMEEYEEKKYESFNDFFIRKFRPGQRVFDPNPTHLPAFAEGRYFGFERIEESTPLPIKGATLNIRKLLGDRPETQSFHGGPGFIARLCPVDYHRFHFPDSGKSAFRERLKGPLHSVNPIALEVKGDILFTNERVLTILETENFGRLAYLEVGAMGVGRIVQSVPASQPFSRGDEKGYFLFGGSTVILVGEPGAFKIDADLLAKTREGIECLVRLGEKIAQR